MSSGTDTELLDNSCSQVHLFPYNILHHAMPQHHLKSYQKHLAEREASLFCEDGLASLDMFEYDDNVKGERYRGGNMLVRLLTKPRIPTHMRCQRI